jgi:hypothetical protein
MSNLRQRRLVLELERQDLKLRCTLQRSALARAEPPSLPGADWARRAALGTRLASRWLRAHPGLAAAGMAAGLLLLRPRSVLGWASTLLTLVSLWQRAQPLLAALPPRPERPRSSSPPSGR